MSTKILLVDDEKDIVEFLTYNLELEGFKVITAYNGIEALQKISELTATRDEKLDLIILDVLMPKMNGYETCERIKQIEEFKNIPVIFLTAKSSETDEIHGLNIGANDFIQKPISTKKLIARIKANLRKNDSVPSGSYSNVITIGPLYIDKEKFIAKVDGEKIFLPKKEFEILVYFASNPGKVFSRDKILSDIWGNDIFVVERTIDVHVRKIREKLGKYSDLIETIKGVGYRFKIME
ncbi:response regulator transcription factor [Melioribacteraceae bacterium 4301-Me]|uniref:response regulator transcription factor n=1 Tax=Pyranulibacter aquaticus TaxID=3163344 RepID=UPI0035958E54